MNRIFKYIVQCILVGAFLLQSCNNGFEEFSTRENDFPVKMEFLRCSKDIMFSEQGKEIVNKAFQRIEEYLVVKEDTCYLTVTSAEDVNMSDIVFSMVKQAICNANIQYKTYLYFKEKGMEGVVKNPFNLKLYPVITRVNSESVYGTNFSTTIITLDHVETITVINAMRTANGAYMGFAGIISSKFAPAIASVLITTYAFLIDSELSNIQDEYARSGSTKGITLTQITTYSPTTGMSYTAYNGNINY